MTFEMAEIENMINEQNFSTAKSELQKILTSEPRNINALNNLAVAEFLEGNYEAAVYSIDKVLEIDPGNDLALSNLGVINTELRNLIDGAEQSDGVSQQQFDWENGWTQYCKGEGIEIGCGGKPLPELNSYQVDIVDDFNGEKYHVDHLAVADELDFAKDDTLDYVVNSNLFEHLANPIKALREWRRVLKPGGILYLIIPDKRLWYTDRQRSVSFPDEWQNAYNMKRSNAPVFPNNPNTHFFAYTLTSFIDCLEYNRINEYFELINCYGLSDSTVEQIAKELPNFIDDPEYWDQGYLRMQQIARENNECAVGHNFHMVLKAV